MIDNNNKDNNDNNDNNNNDNNSDNSNNSDKSNNSNSEGFAAAAGPFLGHRSSDMLLVCQCGERDFRLLGSLVA